MISVIGYHITGYHIILYILQRKYLKLNLKALVNFYFLHILQVLDLDIGRTQRWNFD